MRHKEVIRIDEVREALEQMEMTDGWQYVKRYIDERIADHTNQLLVCDIERVALYRNSINTLKLIYEHIENLKKPPEQF